MLEPKSSGIFKNFDEILEFIDKISFADKKNIINLEFYKNVFDQI